ncbi:MAG: DUF3883 domain-containing protein [Pseudomonadota bacterium]
MARGNDDIIGKPWSDEELDLIVADYFAMRDMELAGLPFVKAHHASDLMARTGRTHRSVEFKHMNISAVLEELGTATIKGYKGKANYQNAIFDAVDRYLIHQPGALDPPLQAVPFAGGSLGVREAVALLYDEPPPDFVDRAPRPRPEGLERLVRKFDPVERDFRNRALGKAGEELVYESERRRLHDAGAAELARQVRWVAQEEGDGAGYDILSFTPRGERRMIEVKTTNGGQRTPFFLSRNEKQVSDEQSEFRLYRLYDFARGPRLFRLKPPLDRSLRLETEVWRAGFG